MADPLEVRIRRARVSDLPSILQLFSEDALHFVSQEKTAELPEVDEAYVRALELIQATPDNNVYVAEADGRVAGTFQLTFIQQLSHCGARVAQVENVFVLAEQRSRGIGSAMLRFAIEEAAQHHCIRIQLTTNVRRERAHAFYQRLGFEPTHHGMKRYLR
ncbi:MAG TPA: GNAT family N-acetyltransferase [Polyangiaceae bacterium]|nr:GNAT family N-acetyltransferase [Polyangiaceae bacterium]